MIKKLISFLVVLLVILEYTSAITSARIFTKNMQVPVTTQEYEKKKQVITIVCKDEYIASVIAKSKYPYTLAAIAKVESDYKPQVRGDNGKSYGLYQIQAKHWGYVPNTVEGQTRKAERILDTLIEDYGFTRAIERYNGSGKCARRYRERVFYVLKQLQQTERGV